MRVLVTGATATLGRAVVDALVAAPDVEVVLAIGREPANRLRASSRLVVRCLDLTRPRQVHDLLWGEAAELGIDRVVHDMHHRHARTGRDQRDHVHAQNVDATRELLHGCQDHPSIRRFVYRSFAEVYALGHTTSNLIDEDEPLEFAPTAPQWVRDRVESDLEVCSRLAGPLAIANLRCAEILAPGTGSQLWDYLQSRVCMRPFGFDPMVNVLSLDDAVAAIVLALRATATGVFNIPGADTLPLSRAIALSRRADIPVPGPLMAPLYGLRRWAIGSEFRYDMNLRRFHFGGVLDGARARAMLGYEPHTPTRWPRAWWHELMERLAATRADEA
jgi:UDP-glucose 4-epimerase